MKARKFLSALLVLVMVISMIPMTVATERDRSNVAQPVEDWVYTTETENVYASNEVTLFSLPEVTETVESASSDIVEVHVTAKEKDSGANVDVSDASVRLYVGSELISTTSTDSKGIARVSLAALSIEERSNATISADKVVSRGKAINGTARDDLFENFPKDEDGDYYRYTMELHSETIDSNGNWLGKKIPKGMESNKVDMVFAIDATGSMSDEINNVKTNIADFAKALIEQGLDIRFCIMEYLDITTNEPTHVYRVDGSRWYSDLDTVVDVLGDIDLGDGGDWAETPIDALGIIADSNAMEYRSDAYKFAFVLTDADYKNDNNYGYKDMADVTAALKKQNIVTSVITDSGYKNLYKTLYSETKGIYANIYAGDFAAEMKKLADNVVASVTREMELELKEPRLLVNMSVCYFANDKTSQSANYKESVKNMLNEYSHRLAETTDGHVMLDRVLLFSTNNRLNFYDTNNIASMADLRIETRESDDGKWLSNVQIHSNAHVTGFYSDETYTAAYNEDNGETEHFSNLKNGNELNGRRSFYRIQMSGVEGAGWNNSMIDDAYAYSTTVMHESGHYLLGFFDEYLNADGDSWSAGTKPYSAYGLMDNQHTDIEMSKAAVDYTYMAEGFVKAPKAQHTKQSFENGGACEDSLATLLTDSSFSSYYYGHIIRNSDYSLGKYQNTYTKAAADRYAGYSYAGLSDSDFLSLTLSGGGGGGAWSLRGVPQEPEYTETALADAAFESADDTVKLALSGENVCTVAFMKSGDEHFTDAEVIAGVAELPVAKGEIAEVRVTSNSGDVEKYNVYYIDRSGDVDSGYLYTSGDNAATAYVTTDEKSSYTFIADNTDYTNGDYVSVSQATWINSDNGTGFDSGEIYAAANYLAEIDYTTLQWFKYANGAWVALDTDFTEEENMNIGARADLDGEGLYVLMAKMAPKGGVQPAKNLAYTQSEEQDAVVTLSFKDPNSDSKYYNVYYSEENFSDKNAEGVVVRSFSAGDGNLQINLLERGRVVYAAVEIVAEDGRRSELSEIVLIGGEADSDGDGIPDWYCDKYQLWGEEGENKDIANSDDDEDGLTNLEEYRGGSDPKNPNDPAHTTNVPVDSVRISDEQVKLQIGEKKTVTATVLPENASNKNVRWRSENTDVATVEANDGVCNITAVALGETTVYAVTADGGYSAPIKVIVTDIVSYTITAEAEGNGTITPEGTVTVLEGEAQSFNFEADEGYEVVEVAVDGELTGVADSYTFENVTDNHTIKVTFGEIKVDNDGSKLPWWLLLGGNGGKDFDDVTKSDWFYDDVDYVSDKDLMNGTSEDLFAPYENTSRAMVVTILYRLADEPYVYGGSTFVDVADGQWYTEAVIWAAENDIVTGYGNGCFGPNDSVTREQLAAILYRYAQFCGKNVTASANLSGYADYANISSWARTAMEWANAEGLINGRTETTIAPAATANRAELAAILHRFCK